jgi:hypothetical protein
MESHVTGHKVGRNGNISIDQDDDAPIYTSQGIVARSRPSFSVSRLPDVANRHFPRAEYVLDLTQGIFLRAIVTYNNFPSAAVILSLETTQGYLQECGLVISGNHY